jgi:hypothetical protein
VLSMVVSPTSPPDNQINCPGENICTAAHTHTTHTHCTQCTTHKGKMKTAASRIGGGIGIGGGGGGVRAMRTGLVMCSLLSGSTSALRMHAHGPASVGVLPRMSRSPYTTLICDMQEKFRPLIHKFPSILNRCQLALDSSRILGLPVIVSGSRCLHSIRFR